MRSRCQQEANRRRHRAGSDRDRRRVQLHEGHEQPALPGRARHQADPQRGQAVALRRTTCRRSRSNCRPKGATFFEQAMQGQGGAVSIVYDLWFWARLPPDQDRRLLPRQQVLQLLPDASTPTGIVWTEDSYRETMREQMISSESMTFDFNWGGVTDEKVRGPIRDWAPRALEESVERNMIDAIAPVPDDQRKLPDGIEDVTRDITNTKISNVSIHYSESQTVEWNVAPQGILPNITTLKDEQRQPDQVERLRAHDRSRRPVLQDAARQRVRQCRLQEPADPLRRSEVDLPGPAHGQPGRGRAGRRGGAEHRRPRSASSPRSSRTTTGRTSTATR